MSTTGENEKNVWEIKNNWNCKKKLTKHSLFITVDAKNRDCKLQVAFLSNFSVSVSAVNTRAPLSGTEILMQPVRCQWNLHKGEDPPPRSATTIPPTRWRHAAGRVLGSVAQSRGAKRGGSGLRYLHINSVILGEIQSQ